MSLAQLKDELVHLQPAEQRELMAFLVSQETARDEEFKRMLARKIDDNDPANWMELDDVQKLFAE